AHAAGRARAAAAPAAPDRPDGVRWSWLWLRLPLAGPPGPSKPIQGACQTLAFPKRAPEGACSMARTLLNIGPYRAIIVPQNYRSNWRLPRAADQKQIREGPRPRDAHTSRRRPPGSQPAQRQGDDGR